MTADNIVDFPSLNEQHIRSHIEFIFNHTQQDDAVFEIGLLRQGSFFSKDRTEDAIKRAIELNSQGKSVYCIYAGLAPDTAPFGRASDADFYTSNFVWCDIDDPHDSEGLKKLYGHCPPTIAIVTAREPHRRIQLAWLLKESCEDPSTIREALIGICDNLGGDPKVTNPTSLMRLGGTVNFPNPDKLAKGRTQETTVFNIINNNSYYIDDIINAFPVQNIDGFIQAQEQEYKYAQDGTLSLTPKVEDGRETLMHKMTCAAIINLTQQLERWPEPQEVFDDVWPVYSRSVKSRTGNLETEGRGQKALKQKILSKLRNFKNGRMERYGFGSVENIVISKRDVTREEVINPETGEVTEKVKIQARDITDIDLENIPPRAWLYGTIAARKYVTMIGASPGAGKSIFTMQVGVGASSGKPFGTHAPQEDNIRTWIYNNEEGEEELRRRLKGILLHNEINPSELSGKFFMNSGEDQSICIARRDIEDGGVVHTPDYEALKEEVLAKNIDLLIIDPFAETHDLSENSNDELKRVAGLYRSIAIDCNCAVVLVHHTRKGGSNDSQSSEQNSNMDNMRGAGAQLGVVRRVFTLAKMDEKTAKAFDISPDTRRWYVRLDDAKSNITAPADSAEWFKFKSLPIGNGSTAIGEGDHVGVLVHKTPEEITNEESARTSEERILLLTRLARVFIKNSVETAAVQKCAEMLLEDGYGKYKDRTLRKIIPDFVKSMNKNTPIVAEGYRCFFNILEGGTKRDGTKICLHMKEISDF